MIGADKRADDSQNEAKSLEFLWKQVNVKWRHVVHTACGLLHDGKFGILADFV